MSVGTRLKQQRIRADLDIKEVAHRVGKSYQYVWRIEEGINEPPTWPLLGEFARVYGTSVDYLLELTDNPRPASNDTLPEGAQEIIDYLEGMSDRGRAELLTIAKSIRDLDKSWQDLAKVSNMISQMGGVDKLYEFREELRTLAPELGVDVALDEIIARRLAEQASRNEE